MKRYTRITQYILQLENYVGNRTDSVVLHNFVEDFHHPTIARTLQYIEMDILPAKNHLSNGIQKMKTRLKE